MGWLVVGWPTSEDRVEAEPPGERSRFGTGSKEAEEREGSSLGTLRFAAQLAPHFLAAFFAWSRELVIACLSTAWTCAFQSAANDVAVVGCCSVEAGSLDLG